MKWKQNGPEESIVAGRKSPNLSSLRSEDILQCSPLSPSKNVVPHSGRGVWWVQHLGLTTSINLSLYLTSLRKKERRNDGSPFQGEMRACADINRFSSGFDGHCTKEEGKYKFLIGENHERRRWMRYASRSFAFTKGLNCQPLFVYLSAWLSLLPVILLSIQTVRFS